MAVCCSVEVWRCFQLISESLKIQVASVTDFYPLGSKERYESPGIIRLLQTEKAVDLQIQYTSKQAITKTCILLLRNAMGDWDKDKKRLENLRDYTKKQREREEQSEYQNKTCCKIYYFSHPQNTSELLEKFYQVFSRIEKGQDLYYYIDLKYACFEFKKKKKEKKDFSYTDWKRTRISFLFLLSLLEVIALNYTASFEEKKKIHQRTFSSSSHNSVN